MRHRALVAVIFATLALRAGSSNINSRYTVENVEIVPARQPTISGRLKADIKRIVGQRLDQSVIDSLRDRLKFETGARNVIQMLVKGGAPNSVKVVFEVERKEHTYDIEIPKLLYHTSQGVSGQADGVMNINGHRLVAGYVNDGDQSVERFSGLRASYEKRNVGGRYSFRIQFQNYWAQWSTPARQSLTAAGLEPGLYRSRWAIEPEAAIQLGNSVVYSFGVSVQSLQMQFPAARTETANAVIQSLRFHRRWRAADTTQIFDAGYRLHAATTLLASDFAYARHSWDARYRLRRGNHEIMLAFNAGTLGGRGPLHERFIAGNSTCLRGWDKYEITPAGKTNLAAGTVEYTYKLFQAFYDMGNAWNPGEALTVRHSLGASIRAGARGPVLSLAFPARAGRLTPIFLTTLNF